MSESKGALIQSEGDFTHVFIGELGCLSRVKPSEDICRPQSIPRFDDASIEY